MSAYEASESKSFAAEVLKDLIVDVATEALCRNGREELAAWQFDTRDFSVGKVSQCGSTATVEFNTVHGPMKFNIQVTKARK